jgi:hypothetical protein
MNRSGMRAREAACDFVRLAVMVDAVICCALQREFSPLDANPVVFEAKMRASSHNSHMTQILRLK